jgi:hypothetical protein
MQFVYCLMHAMIVGPYISKENWLGMGDPLVVDVLGYPSVLLARTLDSEQNFTDVFILNPPLEVVLVMAIITCNAINSGIIVRQCYPRHADSGLE